jgi:hypothetical protein
MNSTVDLSTVAVAFALVLAVLAGSLLVIRHIVRRNDVLHGGYVEDDEDKVNPRRRAVAAPMR